MGQIEKMDAMSKRNLGSIDLTPFSEPMEIEIQPFGAGISVNTRIHIDYRWGVKTEWLETKRVFGHKPIGEDQAKKEMLTAVVDMQEKLLWVFKANHGLLDTESSRMRFEA